MTRIDTKNFSIYFGDSDDNIRHKGDCDFKKLPLLQKKLNLAGLFFLKQTHSTHAVILKNELPGSFQIEGDAIITKEKNIGIGVVTADCLPVVLYDPVNHAIGVIHAGWQGLAKKIITATIKKMYSEFGTDLSQLKAYFGPSAGVCCYEVQADFLTHFPESAFEKRDGKFYFNEGLSGLSELIDNGVLADNINTDNNICTICQPGFCSVRKQKENAGRQPSVVALYTP
ncbi:MAG: polyphenol oxidase family protein [Gammaproteobacteria bacterium]|nr:polyphenol oxidase family protein [Gammaproteobacteria bacterium]